MSLIVVAPAAAESQRFKWWHSERFQQEMGLSPDQASRIEAIFEAALPALRAQKRALDKLEDELSRMVADAKAPEAEFEQFVTRVEAARGELGKTRTMMLFRMRRVLTLDQHLKLQKLYEERERERHGRSRQK